MSYQILDPTGVRGLIASGADVRILDVRTVEEFEDGHIEGSYNLPILFHRFAGIVWNERFEEAVERHFTPEERLVFV
ncbi:MAG TPA: rhodanese-like domain-containing protein [Planctomycetes bacterium]|nr:rhodanese-like domain-containing protein [Planctomycetota bacterium]